MLFTETTTSRGLTGDIGGYGMCCSSKSCIGGGGGGRRTEEEEEEKKVLVWGIKRAT